MKVTEKVSDWVWGKDKMLCSKFKDFLPDRMQLYLTWSDGPTRFLKNVCITIKNISYNQILHYDNN